jgi:hypothetical protein
MAEAAFKATDSSSGTLLAESVDKRIGGMAVANAAQIDVTFESNGPVSQSRLRMALPPALTRSRDAWWRPGCLRTGSDRYFLRIATGKVSDACWPPTLTVAVTRAVFVGLFGVKVKATL